MVFVSELIFASTTFVPSNIHKTIEKELVPKVRNKVIFARLHQTCCDYGTKLIDIDSSTSNDDF